MRGGLLTIVFGLVVAAGVAYVALDSPPVAELGRPAPAIAFQTFDGEVFDLVEHLRVDGGPVLLNLWASWCPPCLREFPALSEFAVANPGVTVVGVAVQDQLETARRFVDDLQPRFTVGFDSDGSVRTAYPSFGLPATFLIDSDGVVTEALFRELTPEILADLDI